MAAYITPGNLHNIRSGLYTLEREDVVYGEFYGTLYLCVLQLCTCISVIHHVLVLQSIFSSKWRLILSGQEGVLCHMNDVLIFGKDHEEHDDRLLSALQKIRKAVVTQKCEFSSHRLTFLWHIIDERGVSPDPTKPLPSVLCQSQLTGQSSGD